ncbi:hypothetical protein NP493_435g00000 [Ridgeia piscesae]|uniref:Autophagy-related protein 2 n=1 Tax=Ridgeia piscesae TaxID=27915 RepID=A0AAD9NTZ2_RIDPI|nr:hypothetical protein NP493_435g00000 [Ridgeia piscesae]
MPWYFPWSDSIKKRACRYLLQHYLGHFFKEKLSLEQLSVDLYNGRGTIQEVLLDVVSINEALENFNAPVEVVDGFIGNISVSIPWSALVSDNTVIEVHNLELTIQSKRRPEHTDGQCPGATLDSMLSSMTTSLQLAQECLKEEPSAGEQLADAAKPFEGLEMFAQTIEAGLHSVKVSFIDTIVRLEHLPREAKTGAAIEFRIGRIDYYDDQAMETSEAGDGAVAGAKNVYEPAAIALKNIRMYEVTIWCEEFPEYNRTFCKTSSSDSSSPRNYTTPDTPLSPLFSPLGCTVPEFPAASSASLPSLSGVGGARSPKETEPIKIAVLRGRHEVKLKIKQSEALHGPKLEVDGHFGAINVHLSPRQVHLLIEIVKGLSMPGVGEDGGTHVGGYRAGSKPMQSDDFHRVEQELAKQLHHGKGSGATQRLPSWQGSEDAMLLQSLDDTDDEDMYFDFCPSRHSGLSSMESSCSSNITISSTRSTVGPVTSQPRRQSSRHPGSAPTAKAKQKSAKHKETIRKLLDDPTAELMRYRLKLSFMSVVILHEDPPATPGDRLDVGQTSAEKLKSLVEAYYGRVEGIVTSGMGTELSELRKQFSQACRHDHICLLCKPVTVECNQKTTSQMDSVSSDITVGSAELVEAVFDRLTMGLYRCKDDVPTPEYCEVSGSCLVVVI